MADSPTTGMDRVNALAAATRARSGGMSAQLRPPRPSEKLAPRWKAWRPLSGIDKLNRALRQGHKALDKVSKILDKAKKAIQAARAVVSLLKVFEAMLQNVLYAFVNVILDQAQQALNDAKSTGVYMLDMTSYHWKNKPERTQYDDSEYNTAIRGGSWNSIREPITEAVDAGRISFSAAGLDAFAEMLKQLGVSYKKETYNQFINRACEAFLDVDDVADSSLAYGLWQKTGLPLKLEPSAPNREASASAYLRNAVSTDRAKTDKFQIWPNVSMQIPKFMQSGRPNFGDKATMKVIFIAFALPQFEQIAALCVMITKMVTIDTFNIGSEAFKAFFGSDPKMWNSVKSAFTNMASNTRVENWNVFPTLPANRPPGGARGKEPNFIGINAYQLAAPLFDLLQNVVDYLRSLSVNTDQSLLDVIDRMLRGIENEVDRLIRIVAMIDHLLTMIEAFLSITGVRVLIFSTNRGNAGVVEGLKNAKGFNEDDVQGKIERAKRDAEDLIAKTTNHVNALSERLAVVEQARVVAANKASDIRAQISRLAVDVAYFSSKGIAAPGHYDPSASEAAWSTYPSDAKTLYQQLADAESQAADLARQAEQMRVTLRQARQGLIDARSALASVDPAAAERRRRNIAARELRSMKAAADKAKLASADAQARLANLGTIKGIVDGWISAVTSAGLFTKRAALAAAEASYNQQINAKQGEIDALRAAKTGVNGIEEKIAAKQNEKAWANSGRDIDGDGVKEIKGYDDQIAELQAEKAALIAQKNDPEQPEPENYEERIAAIDSEIAALQSEKAVVNAAYDADIADLQYAKSYIDGTTPASYETALSYAREQITTLRQQNDKTVPGSQAHTYDQLDQAYAAAISAGEAEIAALDAELVAVTHATGVVYGRIAQFQVDPGKYTPKPSCWVDGAGPDGVTQPIPVSPEPSAPWGATAPDLIWLFEGKPSPANYEERGYWWLKARPGEIASERSAIDAAVTQAKADKANNLAAWRSYSASNVRQQTMRWGVIASALPTEISIRDKSAEKAAIAAARDAETAAMRAEIQSIVDSGWEEHLSQTGQFYKGRKPSRTKDASGAIVWEDWTKNEIGWLMAAHNYNRLEPRVIDGKAVDVENGIAAYSNEASALAIAAAASQSAYERAVKEEEGRRKKYDEKKRLRSLWTPTQKMYYGGFIFCIGWPDHSVQDEQGRSSYFNIGQIYKEFWSDPLGRNDQSGLFGAQMKSASAAFGKQWSTITALFGKEE